MSTVTQFVNILPREVRRAARGSQVAAIQTTLSHPPLTGAVGGVALVPVSYSGLRPECASAIQHARAPFHSPPHRRSLPPTLPLPLSRSHGVRPRGRFPSEQPQSELAAPRLRSEDAQALRADHGAEIFAEISEKIRRSDIRAGPCAEMTAEIIAEIY